MTVWTHPRIHPLNISNAVCHAMKDAWRIYDIVCRQWIYYQPSDFEASKIIVKAIFVLHSFPRANNLVQNIPETKQIPKPAYSVLTQPWHVLITIDVTVIRKLLPNTAKNAAL
jgi:hypothetical protein